MSALSLLSEWFKADNNTSNVPEIRTFDEAIRDWKKEQYKDVDEENVDESIPIFLESFHKGLVPQRILPIRSVERNDLLFYQMSSMDGVNEKTALDFGDLQEIHMVVSNNRVRFMDNISPTNLNMAIHDMLPLHVEGCGDLLVISEKYTGKVYLCYASLLLNKVTTIDTYESQGSKSWNIRVSSSSRSLVFFDKQTGSCEVVNVTPDYKFHHMGQIKFGEDGEASISQAEFLNNEDNSRTYLLFIISRMNVISYVLVEYNSDDIDNDSAIHELPHLTYNKTINGLIPLSNKNFLLFSINKFSLVNVDQIMSGELVFPTISSKLVKGTIDWIHAPELLQHLKENNSEEFDRFTDCVIVTTAIGNITAIFISNISEVISYPLTRLKGIRSISPMFYQNSLNKNIYEIVALTFGRSMVIKIDLNLAFPSGHQERKDSIRQALLDKKIIGCDSEISSELIFVKPSYVLDEVDPELWLGAPNAICRLNKSSPTEKYIMSTYMDSVIDYDRILNIDSILKGALRGRNPIDDTISLLLLSSSQGRSEILSVDSNYNFCNRYYQDILIDANVETLDFYEVEDYVVQVTPQLIFLKHINTLDIITYPITDGIILKISHVNKFIIFQKGEKLYYITDITKISEIACQELKPLSDPEHQKAVTDMCVFQKLDILSNCAITICAILVGNVLTTLQLNPRKAAFENKACIDMDSYGIASQLVFHNDHIIVKTDRCLVLLKVKETALIFDSCIWCDRSGKDWRIKPVKNGDLLMFDCDSLFLIKVDKNFVKHEIDLCRNKKDDIIIDACLLNDDTNSVAAINYGGLQISTKRYSSWYSDNHILHHTRNPNKAFLYLSKLNRMLVVDKDIGNWDIVKLKGNKTLPLDESYLKNREGEIFTNFIELETHPNETMLLMTMEKYIRIVKISTRRSKIQITTIYDNENSWDIAHVTKVSKNKVIFHVYGDNFHTSDLHKFIMLTVGINDDLRFTTIHEFKSLHTVNDFFATENELLIVIDNGYTIYYVKYGTVKSKQGTIPLRLSLPSESKFLRAEIVDNTHVALAFQCDLRGIAKSKIVLIDLEKIRINIALKRYEPDPQEDKDYFETDTNDDEDAYYVIEDWDIDYMEQFDYTIPIQNIRDIGLSEDSEDIMSIDLDEESEEEYEDLQLQTQTEDPDDDEPLYDGGVQLTMLNETNTLVDQNVFTIGPEQTLEATPSSDDESMEEIQDLLQLNTDRPLLDNMIMHSKLTRKEGLSTYRVFNPAITASQDMGRMKSPGPPEENRSLLKDFYTINLDKTILDLKFEPGTKKLYVLTADQSVIVFGCRKRQNKENNGLKTMQIRTQTNCIEYPL
ncbi:hypothetical protein RNJ44_01889 [Nakaseomyces bracarensis]|uniref:Cleavage/polyadenylation specificity factor A subunit N-terminal domain-containing protein n=1 Tax=Nakaseomyces bracarensis TaxID=273131 RepID=A0ABR4NP25_9SACH